MSLERVETYVRLVLLTGEHFTYSTQEHLDRQ